MKLIIAGSRWLTDRGFVLPQIEASVAAFGLAPTMIVTGGARGVDTIAAEWARTKGFPSTVISARWDLYGRHAGPRRNKEMLDLVKPDGALLVIRFMHSAGSLNMLTQSKREGLRHIDIVVEDESNPRVLSNEVHLPRRHNA